MLLVFFDLFEKLLLYILIVYFCFLILLYIVNIILHLCKKESLSLRVVGYCMTVSYFLFFIGFSWIYQKNEERKELEPPSISYQQLACLEDLYIKTIDRSGVTKTYSSIEEDGEKIEIIIDVYPKENEKFVAHLEDIANLTDKFIAYNSDCMNSKKIYVGNMMYEMCYIKWTDVSLRNYKCEMSEEILSGEKHWIIEMNGCEVNDFKSLMDQYSFSAGIDGNIYIKDPSDYRILENWDGLQYFSCKIAGSLENAYEIGEFLTEKYPDADYHIGIYTPKEG